MSRTVRACLSGVALLSAVLLPGPAGAQVTVQGTRVIFPGDRSDVSVRLKNTGNRPALMQVWLDAGDAESTPENSNVPFLVRPPMFRLDGGKSQVARIHFTGASLPSDRETLYWLNALEIPPKPAKGVNGAGNHLQLSLRTRIKVFYRPQGLNARGAAEAPHHLEWSVIPEAQGGYALRVQNPTPYFVNFSSIELSTSGKTHSYGGIGLVAPGEHSDFPVEGLISAPAAASQVKFQYINDQGGAKALEASLR